MSAQRLREAARVLDERSKAATPEPWEAWQSGQAEFFVSRRGAKFFGLVATPGRDPDDYGKSDAAYIAMMQPSVAALLANWLGNMANRLDLGLHVHSSDRTSAEGLARLILGGTP